jgi:hypothetical protein
MYYNSRSGNPAAAQRAAEWIRGEQGDIARIGDDIYTGKDGTIYRQGSNGWESNTGGGWNQVDKPSTPSITQRSKT